MTDETPRVDQGMGPLAMAAVLADAGAREALAWEPFRDGIEVSWVYKSTDPDGPAAAFLRYRPGASAPLHEHTGIEHILVLEGAQEDHNGVHRAGELTVNPPGTRHAVVSQTGCTVLAIWTSPVRFC